MDQLSQNSTKKILIAALALITSGANAQDRNLSFELGFGAQAVPGYFGSNELVVGPSGSFAIESLTFGGFSMGDGEPDGFGFKGGFRYIAERSSDDYSELTGLRDIDAAVELGGGISFTNAPTAATGNWGNTTFGEVRYGVPGHEAFVAELGADLIYAPSQDLEFRFGPRLLAGDGKYSSTYFGVTDAEAMASNFAAFDASGDLVSSGIEARIAYRFTPDWGIVGTIAYDEYVNDAARSPIVRQGSGEQLSMSLMVTRAFAFEF